MSHNTPINYIFIEGPDCSGKTTLYEMIHKESGYQWNIQDRSALSMLIHARYYGRDTFNHVEQLKKELYNINNQLVICLPDWKVIVDRFQKRGDPIQNITSLRKIYELFEEAVQEFQNYANVTVIRQEIDKHTVKDLVTWFKYFENRSLDDLQTYVLQTVAASGKKEVLGFNFVHYDTGDFNDINKQMLSYDKEKDYYQKIETAVFDKIKLEMKGENEYEREEGLDSRRFIYTDDSCISLAHFLVRDGHMDAKFFLRSSNVKDTLKYDLNFIKHLSGEVFRHFKCDRQGDYCKIEVVINSGHVI
jgi:deoxyadenosine/deoxycytidine kinase